MKDICFPTGNEEKFIEIAEKLNKKELCFVYGKRFERKEFNTDIKISYGVLAKNKKEVRESKGFVVVEAGDNIQYIMDKLKPDLIFNFETSMKKDRMHYRNSGMNHVLCKLAAENDIIIGFSFSELFNSTRKHVLLGRMRQNMRFCRKFGCKVIVGSFAKNPFELRSDKQLQSLRRLL